MIMPASKASNGALYAIPKESTIQSKAETGGLKGDVLRFFRRLA